NLNPPRSARVATPVDAGSARVSRSPPPVKPSPTTTRPGPGTTLTRSAGYGNATGRCPSWTSPNGWAPPAQPDPPASEHPTAARHAAGRRLTAGWKEPKVSDNTYPRSIKARDLTPGMQTTGYLPAFPGGRAYGCDPIVRAAVADDDQWM